VPPAVDTTTLAEKSMFPDANTRTKETICQCPAVLLLRFVDANRLRAALKVLVGRLLHDKRTAKFYHYTVTVSRLLSPEHIVSRLEAWRGVLKAG
jgi:hypothetical protein